MTQSHSVRPRIRYWLTQTSLAMLLVACLSLVAAAAPVTQERKDFYLQAAVGSDYSLDHPTTTWQHTDSLALSVGRHLGYWLDTSITGVVRTDVSARLNLAARMRLLRLGPASLGLRLQGSIGAGLYSDIWVHRSIAAGLDARVQLGTRHISLWGVAGFKEDSAWDFAGLEAPFAAVGLALQPKAGLSGIVADVSHIITESPVAHEQLEGAWAGQVGYRKAL